MNIYFLLVGFENNCPFIQKFTLTDLLDNKHKDADSEIFYSLKEIYANDIETMNLYQIVNVSLSRDNDSNVGLLTRVTKERYESATASY